MSWYLTVLRGHKSAYLCEFSAYLWASVNLKIMVSPVRIRVPPLPKVRQIEETLRPSDVLPELAYRNRTAGRIQPRASSIALAASPNPGRT